MRGCTKGNKTLQNNTAINSTLNDVSIPQLYLFRLLVLLPSPCLLFCTYVVQQVVLFLVCSENLKVRNSCSCKPPIFTLTPPFTTALAPSLKYSITAKAACDPFNLLKTPKRAKIFIVLKLIV